MNGNTLPLVGINCKILSPRLFPPLGPRDCPRAISRALGCKLSKGAYFPIHPSYRQCMITYNTILHCQKECQYCLESGRIGKYAPPRPLRLPLGFALRQYFRGANCLWGRIFQYIPPFSSVLTQYLSQGRTRWLPIKLWSKFYVLGFEAQPSLV